MTTLDLIESQDVLLEAGLRLKNIIQNIAGKESSDQERFTILGNLAQKEGLPGLYDPVTGQFVKSDGSTSNTADKETDKKLAYMGLIPDNAATSTYWGKVFGTSGDKYDSDLRSTSKGARDAQDLEERQLAQLKELLGIVKQYTERKAAIQKRRDEKKPAVTPTKTTTPATAPVTTPGKTPVPATESVEFTSSIAQGLVESFDYKFEGEIANNVAAGTAGFAGGKIASKVLGKAIPGVATGLSWYDAYNRAKAGDLVGAGIAGLAGAVALIPGVGWIPALGLDMANVGRDLAGGGMTGKDDGQGAKPNSDVKLQQLQKIIGAKPDGIMGPETKAKLTAWQSKQGIKADGLPGPETYGKAGIKEGTTMNTPQSVAEGIASLRDRLAMIENEVLDQVSDESINPFIASDNDEQANEGSDDNKAIMFNKDGKNYAMVPGPNGEAIVVDEMGNEVDGDTLEVIGKADLAEAGWTSALANIFNNFKSGLKGGGTVQMPNPKFPNLGGKIATGGRTANKVGGAISRNPVKTGVGAAALGGLAGYAAGGPSDTGQGPQPSTNPNRPNGPTPATPDTATADAEKAEKAEKEAREKEDAELAALKAKIEALLQGLSTSQNPEVQKGVADIKAQLGS